MLNAARWLTALVGGASAVHVHVEGVKDVPWELLEFLAYLIYPARIEVKGESVEAGGWLEGASGAPTDGGSKPVRPLICHGHETGACTLCGRELDDLFDAQKVKNHVARGEELCPACMIARLFGRAANKAAFLFYVGKGELDLGEQPDAKYKDAHSSAVFKFYRHGGNRKSLDDTAVLSACGATVAVVGIKREVLEAGGLQRYLNEVRGHLRQGSWKKVAEAREEFLRKLVEEVRRQDGLDLGDVIYQPSDCGVVAQLSGVNAWGALDSTDLDILAASEGTNTVYVIRIDGDKFGEFSKRHGNEKELATFKSAVAGAFEASVRSAVIYSGGDESLVAASSRSVLKILAALEAVRALYKRLGEEAKHDLSISAAVVATRYKTPMYYIVDVANRGVEEVKEAGRDGLYFAYLRGFYTGGGVVKFSMLDAVKRAARRYAEEMPSPEDFQHAPELATSAYLGMPHMGPEAVAVVKDMASLLEA